MNTTDRWLAKVRRLLNRTWVPLAAVGVISLIAAWVFRLQNDVALHEPLPSTSVDATTISSKSPFLRGRVTSKSNLELLNATVCAHGQENANQLEVTCTVSDGQGQYVLALFRGQYAVTASAQGHASHSFQLAVSSEDVDLDFTLDPIGASLAGVVRNGAGQFVANASIVVFANGQPIANSQSDAKGEFSAATPAGPLTVKVAAAGYVATIVRTVAPTLDMAVNLYPGVGVRGAVVDKETSQRMANVLVTATRKPYIASLASDQSVRTDAEGQFAFDSLATGEWFLSVHENRVLTIEPVRVALNDASTPPVMTLYVQSGGEVTGRLMTDGKPCERGEVQLIPADVVASASTEGRKTGESNQSGFMRGMLIGKTSTGGQVNFPAAPAGSYVALATCDETEFVDGDEVVTIAAGEVAHPTWNFAIRSTLDVVVEDEAHRPVLEAALLLSPLGTAANSDAAPRMKRGTTNADGTYRFGGLSAGEYELHVRAGGINPTEEIVKRVTLPSNANAKTVATLSSIGSITIVARDKMGTPSSRMLFHATNANDQRFESYFVGDGRFRLFPLPKGRYKIWAYDNKNPKQAVTYRGSEIVAVTGSEPLVIEFVASKRSGIIEGRVIDQTGRPVINANVQAISSTLSQEDAFFSALQTFTQGAQHVTTDQSGAFKIVDVDDQGLFRITVLLAGKEPIVRESVRAGESLELRVSR